MFPKIRCTLSFPSAFLKWRSIGGFNKIVNSSKLTYVIPGRQIPTRRRLSAENAHRANYLTNSHHPNEIVSLSPYRGRPNSSVRQNGFRRRRRRPFCHRYHFLSSPRDTGRGEDVGERRKGPYWRQLVIGARTGLINRPGFLRLRPSSLLARMTVGETKYGPLIVLNSTGPLNCVNYIVFLSTECIMLAIWLAWRAFLPPSAQSNEGGCNRLWWYGNWLNSMVMLHISWCTDCTTKWSSPFDTTTLTEVTCACCLCEYRTANVRYKNEDTETSKWVLDSKVD